MPSLAGTTSSIHFGFTDKLPDWRKEPPNLDDDNITLEEEGIPSAGLIARLGFDPRKLRQLIAEGEAKLARESAAKEKAEVEHYSRDAAGHEHKGTGEGGGQFTGSGGGGDAGQFAKTRSAAKSSQAKNDSTQARNNPTTRRLRPPKQVAAVAATLFHEHELALPHKPTQPQATQHAVYESAKHNIKHYAVVLDLGKGVSKDIGATVLSNKDEIAHALTLAGQGKAPALIIIAPLKGEVRAAEKVNGKYDGDWSKLQDVVRASVIVPSITDLPKTVAAVRKHLELQGWTMAAKPDDKFANPTPCGYSDLALSLRAPDGQVCELQINTQHMWHAKQTTGHKLYEESRRIDEQSKSRDLTAQECATLESLQQQQQKLYSDARSK